MYKIIAPDKTFTFESYNNFRIAEVVERGLKHDYTAVYPDGRVYECKFKENNSNEDLGSSFKV